MRFWGLPWPVWGGLCLIVAAMYVVVWPRPQDPSVVLPFWQYVVLRWFHALVWVCLAVSCFVRPLVAATTANRIAFVGLLLYLVFIATVAFGRTRL